LSKRKGVNLSLVLEKGREKDHDHRATLRKDLVAEGWKRGLRKKI